MRAPLDLSSFPSRRLIPDVLTRLRAAKVECAISDVLYLAESCHLTEEGVRLVRVVERDLLALFVHLRTGY